MTISRTKKATKQLVKASQQIRDAFEKQTKLLMANAGHPSLDLKLYDADLGVWQARVNLKWRFYLKIEGSEYVVIAVTPHPK